MIKHILFDLDSTLYSVRWRLEDFFFARLKEYASFYLGIGWEEWEPLWRDALKRYGTTLEWLCAEKGFTAVDEYLAHMHPENEVDSLPADPELRQFIEKLPLPCSILTNSPGFHADRVIKKLGIEGLFQRVFDIESNNFKGKPHASAFNRTLDALSLKAEEVLFIDDLPRYVSGFLDIGGKGILIDEEDRHPNWPYEKIKNLKEILRYLD